MSTNASFGFLPWARRGLGQKVSQVDDLGTAPTTSVLERASVAVAIQMNTDVIEHDVQLIGPGDILGVEPGCIIRTEPAKYVFDFESNCLAAIEFYEEDFPWLYTPAIENVNKLRPWVALIVLKDEEFSVFPPNGTLPALINITADFADVFHPHQDHWAWAHVHVHQPNDTEISGVSDEQATLIGNLKTDLDTNPDVAIARLLCPRRLQPNTQYTAFLIPAFETGRLAGLGEDVSEIPSLQSSWNLSGTLDEGKRKFPIYYQWRFGTGALGDFESLARALKPRTIQASKGSRPLDITTTGLGIDSAFFVDNPEVPHTVDMEGAVAPPTFVSQDAQDLASIDDSSNNLAPYTEKLLEIINTPYTVKTAGVTGDPVLSPPIYGQWHADVNNVQSDVPTAPEWLQELNLDVRYRAAAGLGAQVVRDRQEYFVESAWQQIGEVLAINDKINKAFFATASSTELFRKHFIGDSKTGDGIINEKGFEHSLKIGGLSWKTKNHPASVGVP